ncbi:MAG: hypothetical protein ACRC18_09500 [Cetobacterium sp.]
MKNKYFLEFSSQLLKEEKSILKLFIEKYLKKEKMEFKLDDLEIPKLRNCKKNYIERLGKKGVFFIDGDIERTYCPFFSFLSFNEDLVKVQFNEKFIEYIINKEKIFKYSLKEVLYLKNSFSIEFFYKILKENILKNSLKIELEKFKEIVTIESYSRLYDLKRFVLMPLVEDINKNTDFKIEVSLNKEKGVWEIEFLIKNEKVDRIKNYTKLFIKLYKNHIIDKKKVALLIFNAINLHSYDYVKSKILFAIKNKKKYSLNFDKLLENVLCDKIGEFYILLKSYEVQAENIDMFRKAIHREIHPLDFPEISTLEYNTNLAKQLYSLKPKEILTLTSENLKLELLFNPEDVSKVDIYKKYIK